MVGNMGGNLGIGVSIFLKDQFSAQSLNVRKQMEAMNRSFQKIPADMMGKYRNQQAAMAGAGTLVLGSFNKAIRAAGDFSIVMQTVRGIVSNTNGITSKEFKNLSEQATALGQATLFSSHDIAEGMESLARSGMDAYNISKNIEAATYLASATGHTLGGPGGAADIMANVMHIYKYSADQATKAADIMGMATNASHMRLEDLAESLKYAGNELHGLNIGLPESAAMLGVLAKSGIRGSMAGTALGSTFRHLAMVLGKFGTKRQKEAIEMLGLQQSDFVNAKGELKSISDIIQIMYEAASKRTNLEGESLLSALFDIRGGRGAQALISSMHEYHDILNKINNSQGTNIKLTEGQMKTLGGTIERLEESGRTFLINFGNALKPVVIPALESIMWVVNKISSVFSGPLGTFLASGIAGFVALKTVGFAYRAITASLRLIYFNNRTAFAQQAASTISGYNAMRNAAAGYAAAAGAATRRGRYSNNYGGYAPGGFGGLGGMATRGVVYNAAGRMVRSRTTGFGRAGGMLSAAVIKRYTDRFGTRGMRFMSGGSAAMGTGMMGRAFGGLTGVLGRLAGIMTGPWGMALSFVLPGLLGSLIGALNDDEEALEENTEAQIYNANKRLIYGGRDMGMIAEESVSPIPIFRDYMKQAEYNDTRKSEAGGIVVENYNDQLRKQNSKGSNVINIHFDGLKKTIESVGNEAVYENLQDYLQ